MAYVSIKVREPSPLPRRSSQAPVVTMALGEEEPGQHQSLAVIPKDESVPVEEEWRRVVGKLIFLCLGKGVKSTLQCSVCLSSVETSAVMSLSIKYI